jgi:hypothetical protein
MKDKLNVLAQRYAAALGKHVAQGRKASLQRARGLGRQAVSLGLETLDVARIHQEALATLEAASSGDGIIKRIQKTHKAALKANAHLSRVNKTPSPKGLSRALSA